MKFMMNGALTIGTRDGATIEMAEEAGEENFFLFGLTAEQVADSRGWYNPHWHYENEPETRAALDLIFSRPLQPQRAGHLRAVARRAADARRPLHAPGRPRILPRRGRSAWCELYADRQAWARKAILNVASSGKFSSDRTIARVRGASIWERRSPVPDGGGRRIQRTTASPGGVETRRTGCHAISPLAGKPAPEELLIDLAAARARVLRAAPGSRRSRAARQLRHQRPSRLVAATASFTEAHILAITQAICDYRAAQGIDGPLYMGKDTHALSGPGAAHGARGAGRQRRRDRHPARRRLHADAGHLARHPRLQPRPHRTTWPTASSSRRRTTRRRTAASSTTRPTAARPTPTSPSWIQDRANELLRAGNRRRQARAATQRRSRRRRRTQEDFVLPYVERPAQRRRHGGDPRRRAQARRRSARRRGRALLGADQRDLRARHRRSSTRRSIRRSRS